MIVSGYVTKDFGKCDSRNIATFISGELTNTLPSLSALFKLVLFYGVKFTKKYIANQYTLLLILLKKNNKIGSMFLFRKN